MEITLERLGRYAATNLPRLAAPVVAVIYLVLWEVAEAGRDGTGFPSIVTSLFAIMIGISARWPVSSLAMMILIPALQLIGIFPPPTSTNWPMYFAPAFAVFFVALRGGKIVRYTALPVGAIAAVLSAWRMIAPSGQGSYLWWTGRDGWFWGVGDAMQTYPFRAAVPMLALAGFGVFIIFWVIGFAIAMAPIDRMLGAAEDRLKKTDLELRMEQDRARISRELHDAIAHSLAVVVSQAEGALAQSDPDLTTRSLRNIAAVGRESLTDMRGLIERIQTDDVLEARPTTSDLPVLVDRMREIGMDATLETYGVPGELTAVQHTATYRIVQESLTNALKHGGTDASVTVTLDWRGPGLALLVSSTGTDPLVSPDPQNPDAGGVGIAGMRERARLSGGWLTAEPSEDGAFLVTAFIPAQTGQHSDVAGLEAAR